MINDSIMAFALSVNKLYLLPLTELDPEFIFYGCILVIYVVLLATLILFMMASQAAVSHINAKNSPEKERDFRLAWKLWEQMGINKERAKTNATPIPYDHFIPNDRGHLTLEDRNKLVHILTTNPVTAAKYRMDHTGTLYIRGTMNKPAANNLMLTCVLGYESM